MDLAPGLRVAGDVAAASLSVAVPVSQDLNGVQHEERVRLTLMFGLTW